VVIKDKEIKRNGEEENIGDELLTVNFNHYLNIIFLVIIKMLH
jgi:hypothetical protein